MTAHDTPQGSQNESWQLILFLSGYNPTWDPIANAVRQMCAEYLEGHYKLEVIDILQQPEQAQAHAILLTPMLIRKHPEPVLRISGDLADISKLSERLQLKSGGNA